MKNVVFISPNFPTNYWQFCKELKANGMNVLGIGDQPYDDLSDNLKNSLNEYYKVSSLENYDEVYRAVAFFIFKYGRIDWLESNNEYWLERDAQLRTEFNITSGFQTSDMPRIKYKSKMKAGYEKANVKTARYHLVHAFEDVKAFIDEVGYPVVIKPDNGVGASDTWKIKSDAELDEFWGRKQDEKQYICEEFVPGHIETFDGITDSNKANADKVRNAIKAARAATTVYSYEEHVDLFNLLDLIPVPETIVGKILMQLARLVVLAYTYFFYMSAALGCGPRDTLLVGLKKRLKKLPIGLVSILLLGPVTLIGWLLGGPVGIGTLLCAFAQGPIMQLSFRTVRFNATAVRHQGVFESLRIFFRKKKKDA